MSEENQYAVKSDSAIEFPKKKMPKQTLIQLSIALFSNRSATSTEVARCKRF